MQTKAFYAGEHINEMRRSGGGREELGHSVKTFLALPDGEKVITITKIIILFNKTACMKLNI